MESNAAKIVVALGSVAVIVVLLFVFAGGDDGGDESTVAEPTATIADPDAGDGKPEKPEKSPKPPKPEFTKIVIKNAEPQGGVAKLDYRNGDQVRLEFVSDVNEHIHVHGYDLFKDVAAGGKVKFEFDADIDGVFEIELEDSGVQLAQLTVKP